MNFTAIETTDARGVPGARSNRITSGSVASLLGVLALVLSLTAQGAEKQVPVPVVHTEPDGTVLRAYEKQPVTDQFYLSITHPGMQTKTVKLPWGLMDVRSIAHGVDGKAIIIGDQTGSLSQVIIVDLSSDTMVDHFLAYGPVASPNGRYIAFTKFYPAHFAQGTSDIELVYDVAKSPQDNRPPGVKVGDFLNRDVGTGVYPPGATAETNNVGVEASKIVHCTSEFFWAPDSSKLVFSMMQSLPPKPPAQPQNSMPPSRTKVSLVLVTFGPPTWLPATKVLTTKVCLDGIGTCETGLTKASFGANGISAFMQAMDARTERKSIQLEYDQFHRLPGLGN